MSLKNSKTMFLHILLVSILLPLFQSCAKKENIMPPKAKKIPKELIKHDDRRIDNYFWMRLSDEQKRKKEPDTQTKDVLDYISKENNYTKSKLAHTEALQKKLYDEIVGRIKKDDSSVPYKENGYYYYTRYEGKKEYPLYCRKKGSLESKEDILLNVNKMAKGYKYYQIGGLSISSDNSTLAFGLDTLSRRIYTVHFKSLSTGERLPDILEGTTGSTAWANDGKTVFYVKRDPKTLRAYKVMKHKLGTPSSQDKVVFEEKDEQFSTFVYKSKSKKYLFIGSSMTETTEFRYVSANTPDKSFKILAPRRMGHEYNVDHYKNKFYIRTNRKGAKNFKLVSTSISKPGEKYWKEIIPHRKDVFLNGIEIFKNYLVVQERKNGLLQIHIISWDKNSDYYMNFDEAAYAAYLSINRDFDTPLLRYYYSSMTTPGTTYDFDMNTKKQTLLKRQEVVGGYNPEEYQTERLYAPAKDGKKIPISLVYKKSMKKSTGNPMLLYAYGSYGATIDANFSSLNLSLLDRGFIYAIAHVRGGKIYGEDWYNDGRLLNKKNTFTDYIDCADYLIKQKMTDSSKLFAYGGSAGGLLMGAVANMKGTLFRGILAAVPFVDVLTTMLDESIPLTTFEYREWGNPNEKKYYDYIKSYSPYDQVEKKEYPNMLVLTGYYDSQVQYWEPLKWTAKLREQKTDKNTLLLDCDMEVGHGGATGRFKAYKKRALLFAFILDLVGIRS